MNIYQQVFPDSKYVPQQVKLILIVIALCIVTLLYAYLAIKRDPIYLYAILYLTSQSLYEIFAVSCTLYGNCNIFSWLIAVTYVMVGLITPVYLIMNGDIKIDDK